MIEVPNKPANWPRLLGYAMLYLLLTLLLIIFMTPVYGAIVTAFKSQAEVSAGGYWTPPTNLAGDNFARVMDPEQGNLGLVTDHLPALGRPTQAPSPADPSVWITTGRSHSDGG